MSVSTARVHRDPGPVMWAVTGAGWLAVLASTVLPLGHLAHPGGAPMALADARGPMAVVLVIATFLGGWLVMVAAMMLPSTVPMARMFTVVSARQHAVGPVRVAFFGAYALVWSVFALIALGGVAALLPLLRQAPPDLVLAGALVVAGASQFTSLTKRCLTVCRDPAAFLFARYRRGVGGAWRLGLRHAMSCLGCCWALMLVMFAAGVGDLLWMLALTAIMVVQKTTRAGAWIGPWVGYALLAVAGVLAISHGAGDATVAPGHHLHLP